MKRLLAGVACLPLAAAAVAEPRDYRLTGTHSFVVVELDTGLSTQRIRLERCEGEIRFDRDAREGRGEVRVALDRLSSGVPTLDAAWRQALNAGGAATARLRVDRLRFDGEALVAAEGRLTLAGREQPMVLAAERFRCYLSPLLRREVCGGDFEAEWDLDASGLRPPPPWPARVRLRVQVEAAAP